MTLEQYIENIDKKYRLGNVAEHTFRGDLQQLIESLVPEISVTNEPKRQACGAPVYILTKNDIPLGFIEAINFGDKDLEGNLKTGNKEEFNQYKTSLSNILFTDYLVFHLYREGQFISQIAIGEIQNGTVVPLPDNFTPFTYFLSDFCAPIGQIIRSSRKLAEMMASKTRLLSEVIEKALTNDEINQEDSTLKEQMHAFKQYLVADITTKGFADEFAQTIAYGMFAARLHDPSLPTFSRQEAAELIPKSNPFLHKLFAYLAGPDIDDRIKWIVDSITEIFLACNVAELLQNYGKATKSEDPIIHFYETFLSEYDPKLRKAKGVWYTPQPVVNFIVRAVDDILKIEFNLPQGLADTSKINAKETEETTATTDQVSGVGQEVHHVQILDPAIGTGSFLAEVVNHVHKGFIGQEGTWSNYVETDLLPRLNGFEKQMASYTMAHLKLDYLLTETGYKPTQDQRFRVYLTNSLGEHQPNTNTLFSEWLSTEANEATHIKHNTPVMCVIGNPPYSSDNANKGEWIMSLMEDYKKGLNENEDNLDEDDIKFIRYGQHFIDKNGSGVLAYVSNNSFIDEITHRQMRKHLLESFDKIYILDLHGNARKKETAADGSPDQNVFDVIHGVSINIFVKTGKKKAEDLGKVYHFDLYGKSEYKYDFLNQNSIKSIKYKEVRIKAPLYFMAPKDFGIKEVYNKGFNINDLFTLNNAGVITARDAFVIGDNRNTLVDRIKDFFKLNTEETQKKYLLQENGGWKIIEVKQNAKELDESSLIKISYRPFDEKHIYYEKSFIESSRIEAMQHFARKQNIGLYLSRQLSSESYSHLFITSKIVVDSFVSNKSREKGYVFPLYLYPETTDEPNPEQTVERKPNLNPEIVNQIAENLGLIFTNEEGTEGKVCFANSPEVRLEFKQNFAPLHILDYIYAVLHSPAYREKYKKFLKTDFPRVPYPKNPDTFWQLVKLGGELRQIHLLESPTVENYITQYPVDGNNLVSKVKYQNGHVYINDTQYFANVPAVAWNFYIGSYQPAQKWLKDRKGRTLGFEDILHYQKIIVALSETARIMAEINKIEIEEPVVGLTTD